MSEDSDKQNARHALYEAIPPEIREQLKRKIRITSATLGPSQCYLDRTSEIEEAINDLIPADKSKNEIFFPNPVRNIYMLAQSARSEGIGNRRKKNGSKIAAKRELSEVTKSAKALYEALRLLNWPAVNAIVECGGALPFNFSGALMRLACQDYEEYFNSLPDNGRDGRPKLIQTQKLTSMLAWVYRDFSGEIPTMRTDESGQAYGPFLDFVARIYAICGVPASPESQAKMAITKYGKKGTANHGKKYTP